MNTVFVLDHPLVQHKLTVLRRADTSSAKFRALAREVSLLLGYEVTRNLKLRTEMIDTPLEPMEAPVLAGHMPCIISILRAGQGILDGMLDLMPNARIGHIGLYRDPITLDAIEYYNKVPEDVAERPVIVVDPMLATGHSAASAVTRLKQAGATDLRFACLLAAPEGLRHFHEVHPDVAIFTAALDRGLDSHGYIRPGLGDAGDRLFGTKESLKPLTSGVTPGGNPPRLFRGRTAPPRRGDKAALGKLARGEAAAAEGAKAEKPQPQ